MVLLYRGWCPFGKQCKYGNRQVCKFYTRKQVVTKIDNHLRYSPWHRRLNNAQIEKALSEMEVVAEEVDDTEPLDDKDEAEEVGDTDPIDGKDDKDEADGAGASHEVKLLQTAVTKLNTTVTKLAGTVPKARPPPYPPGGNRTDTIQVAKPTVRAVLDAFSRAEQALRHSAMVSTSAAQAFTSEANVLQNTRMHIEEVLNMDTTSRG